MCVVCQVILISDPKADKAAGSLDVRVGHMSDPDEIPGLAHFLEHMLFLGTEKYPDEKSYKAFLSAHGGRCNASTSTEHTNYVFDVQHQYLEETLDRFSQFFISPLFTISATDREMKAVHNENAKNLQADSRRNFQFIKYTADPEHKHPFCKFGTGNLTTLRDTPLAKGIDVRSALITFHQQFYSANCMKACILGRENLDVLERWATEKFAPIPNYHRAVPSFPEGAFTHTTGKLYRIEQVREVRSLELFWPVPPPLQFYETNPLGFLCHLLGHEGEGSLLSLFLKQGWATSLSASSSYTSTSCLAGCTVSVSLTPEGLDAIEDIIVLVYQYIEAIRALSVHTLVSESATEKPEVEIKIAASELPVWERVWLEERNISLLRFRFKNQEKPYDYVQDLAGRAHNYPPEHLLTAGHTYSVFDPAVINQYLTCLTPGNMRVHLYYQSPRIAEPMPEHGLVEVQREPWYGTRFSVEPLSHRLLARLAPDALQLHPNLFVHGANPYVVTDTSLKGGYVEPLPDGDLIPPVPLPERDLAAIGCREWSVWYKTDATFLQPKLKLNMLLETAETTNSARQEVKCACARFLMCMMFIICVMIARPGCYEL